MTIESITGIVLSAKPICKTRGFDFCLSFTIQDNHVYTSPTSVLAFRSKESELPVLKPGSIVNFNAKICYFNNRTQLQSPKGPEFHHFTLLDPNTNELTRELHTWWTSQQQHHHPVSNLMTQAAAPKRMTKTISQISPNEYFDLNAVLVHVHTPTDLYVVIEVTDYTINQQLHHALNAFEQDQAILRMTLWDEHKSRILGIQPGAIISLRNVRSKISSDGYLEAVLHGDRSSFSNRVQSLEYDHPFSVKIRRREQALKWVKMPPTSISDSSMEICSLANVGSIDQCVKFRIQAKVIDHMPKNMMDFCRPVCDACEKIFDLMNVPTYCTCGFALEDAYQFLFTLLVSDEKGIVPITVSGEEGLDFCNDLKPCNLYDNPDTFKKLKKRLERLWTETLDEHGLLRLTNSTMTDFLVESFPSSKGQDGIVWRFKVFNTNINYMDDP